MKRFAFLALAFLLACGIFYSITLVLKPKPISKMNPTIFKQPEQIGAVVYRRLRQDVQRAPLVVMGSSTWIHDYEKIWSGFLLTAYNDKKFPKLLYQERDLKLPIEIPGMEVKELSWAEEIAENLQINEVFLIHTTFLQSSRFFADSYANKKTSKRGQEPVTITLLPLAVNEAELSQISPHCPLDEVSETEMELLGCALKRTSKKFFRKKLKPDGLWAVLEQHGPRDYLLFIHEPNANYNPDDKE